MRVEVLCPIYSNISRGDLEKSVRRYIAGLLSDLEISNIRVLSFGERFMVLDIEGKDAEIAERYLSMVMGSRHRIGNIRRGQEYAGRIQNLGEECVYVDIGIEDEVPIVVPYVSIVRGVLGISVGESSARGIIGLLGIAKHLPFVVRIVRIEGTDIIGDIGRRTRNMLKSWLRDRRDRVIVCGLSRSQLDKKIRIAKIHRKVAHVDRLGLLEHAVVCRYGVFADDIARRLRTVGVEMCSLFMPRRAKKLAKGQ